MSKLFYDHLLIIEEITFVIDRHHLSELENKKLLSIIDQTLNNHILDVILTHLPHQFHEEFIHKFTTHPNDLGLIPYLKDKVTVDIEKKILQRSSTIKKELIKEIQAHFHEKNF